MSTIKSILILLIAFGITGCATTNLPPAPPAEEPMDAANAVLIYIDSEPETAYRTIAQVLTDNEYTIASSDPVLYNITTEWRDEKMTTGQLLFSGENRRMQVNASVRESPERHIKLTALFEPAADRNKAVRNQGHSGTHVQKSWQELMELAAQYPNGRVMYARD